MKCPDCEKEHKTFNEQIKCNDCGLYGCGDWCDMKKYGVEKCECEDCCN